MNLSACFKIMRISHWIKNTIIFLPLIFGGRLNSESDFLITIYGAFCFSLITSAIYIYNDTSDIENDKQHEIKKNRPLANGTISLRNAEILGLILAFSGLYGIVRLNSCAATLLALGYVICNIFYSKYGKYVPLLDITLLVVGFLIRVFLGSFLIDVSVSAWLYLTTITTSAYLALGKRRNDLIAAERLFKSQTGVLKYYNPPFLSRNMMMCMTLTIAFYSLWAIEASKTNSHYLIWTVPLVILICMKYSLTIETQKYADPVQVLLSDKVLLCLTGLYGLTMITMLYLL